MNVPKNLWSPIRSVYVPLAFLSVIFWGCKKESTSPNDKTPSVTTIGISLITDSTAVSGGNISSDGGASVASRGVCWATTNVPTIANNKTSDGDGVGNFTSRLYDLTPNTKYYVRAYATNSKGTSYGEEISFTSSESTTGTMNDIDGNVYKTVKINGVWWMAENLKTTRYRNGDSIPNMTNGFQWATAVSGGYCNHDNNPANSDVYGRLYNWLAVSDGRKLAPAGWHIPTSSEWQTLVDGNGGRYLAGGKLKETGNLHWITPNHGATDAVGFRALPGGNRNDAAGFFNKGINGYWWTSTEITGAGSFGVHFSMYTNTAYCENANADKHMGFSVRCVKD